ncbi:MAG: hypothetical protein ABMA25_12585 [Ilumatobacteraceae bacterium]
MSIWEMAMAICEYCKLEMNTARSCTVEVLHMGGMPFPVTRHRARSRCGDCGVAHGGWHHLGCDLQSCPRCGRQLLSCGCHFDEYGPRPAIAEHDDFGDDEPIHISVPATHVHDLAQWDVAPQPFGVDASGSPVECGVFRGGVVIVHRQDIPESDVTTVNGIRCTTAVRTIIDVAVDMEPDDLRATVADAVERGLFSDFELRERLTKPDMDAHAGARAVRLALGLAND